MPEYFDDFENEDSDKNSESDSDSDEGQDSLMIRSSLIIFIEA